MCSNCNEAKNRFDEFYKKHKKFVNIVKTWGNKNNFEKYVQPELSTIHLETSDLEILMLFRRTTSRAIMIFDPYEALCIKYIASVDEEIKQNKQFNIMSKDLKKNEHLASLVSILIQDEFKFLLSCAVDLQEELHKNPYWRYGNFIYAKNGRNPMYDTSLKKKRDDDDDDDDISSD